MERIDVVVPIYNAAAELKTCLDALATRLPDRAALQLVDDASSQAEVSELLRSHPIASRSGTTVTRNESNLGFVGSVNRALARSRNDVALLNSDTVVTDGWLDRLAVCAESDRRIATATPFSNNAEICSFPDFCRANPAPDDPERIAQAAHAAGPPRYPELPTAVGFCMYIRRAAWKQIGGFDEATFGRGYGEENDWCLRATGHGWRHVLCDDAYVAHVGGSSFAGTGHRPGGEQLNRLLARYPHYNALIGDFIARDPLADRRRAILDRLANAAATHR